jgi:hypothetical protein
MLGPTEPLVAKDRLIVFEQFLAKSPGGANERGSVRAYRKASWCWT